MVIHIGTMPGAHLMDMVASVTDLRSSLLITQIIIRPTTERETPVAVLLQQQPMLQEAEIIRM